MSYIPEYPQEIYAAMYGHTPSDYPDGSDPHVRSLVMELNATGHLDVGEGLATASLPLSYWGPPDELLEESQPSQAGPDADNRPLEMGSDRVNGHGRRRATRAARRSNGAAQQGSEDTTGVQGSPTTTRRRQQTAARRRHAVNRGPAAVDIAPEQPLTMMPPASAHEQQFGLSTASSSSSMPDMPNMDGNHVLTPPTGSSNSSMLDVPSMDGNLTFGQPMQPSSELPLTMSAADWITYPTTESSSLSVLEMLSPKTAARILLGRES
ncbi:MAG: hypothetical protein LQ337_001675 [Flavoplaca oasis]|nr:MAG: hypothetical protein LQ337_001675 [Flavoplaca oasis]